MTCSEPNRASADVSEPVTATANQPSTGDRNASAAPAPATDRPIEVGRPEAFMT